MRKYRLIILTILLGMLSLFTYAKAAGVELATEVDKRDLVVELNKTKELMSSIIKDKNVLKFSGVKYLDSDEYDYVNSKITEAEKIIKNEKATKSEINSIKKELFQNINPNLKQISPEDAEELSGTSEYLAKLYDLEIYNYKGDYKEFYDKYYNEKILDLINSVNFKEEYLEAQKEMQTLFDFIRDDNLNKALPKEEYPFLKRKNPFTSTRPKLENLPANNTTFVLTKGKNENLFANYGITAKDCFGEDISVNIGFKQDIKYDKTGITYVQIKVEDKYNNETISKEVYRLVIKNKDTNIAPTITVSEPKEVLAYSKLKNTDLRSFARAKDQYNVILEKENIRYDIFYASGKSANHLFENGLLKKDAGDFYGVFNIKYYAIDNEHNYSKVISKELIVLPKSPQFKSNKITSSNLSLNEQMLNISDLKNIKSFLSDDLIKYYYKATVALKEREYSQLGYNNNASKRDVILYDQVKQFKNLVNKLDGYHMQNYHQLFNYIKGIVVNNNIGSISIPSRDIINLFHRNGVKVYGSINIPSAAYGGQASDIISLCSKDNIDILNELAKEIGFDGWHLGIKRGLYNYSDEFNKLSQARQKEEKDNQAEAKEIVKNSVLPFLKELKEKLNSNHKDLLLESALNIDANDKGSRNYNSLLKEFAQNSNYFITAYDANLNSAKDITDEVNEFKNDTSLPSDNFYKGLYAGYNIDNVDTLNNYFNLLKDKKLATNLFLVNVCERLFSIKNKSSDYTDDNPLADDNLYGSNNYNDYTKRLTMFTTYNNLYNNATDDMLAKLNKLTNSEDKLKFDKARYFNLAEFIIPRHLVGAISTNFNLANTYKYNGSNETDFTNYKDFFNRGGFNQLALQDILPTWLNNTSNNSSFRYSNKGTFIGSSNLNYQGLFGTGAFLNTYLYAIKDKSQGQVYKIKYQLQSSGKVQLELFYTTSDNTDHIIGLKEVSDNNLNTIEFSLPNDNKDIIAIGLKITNMEATNNKVDINLVSLYFGSNQAIEAPKELENFNIDKVGYNRYISADCFLSYEKLDGLNRYLVYQVVGDKEYLLGASYENTQFIKNIKRYKNASAYDEEFKLKVVAINSFGQIVGQKELTKKWEAPVEDLSLAKIKLDKKIAKVGEAITMELIQDENFASYEIDFFNKPGEPQEGLVSYKNINGSNKISLVFYKEGFYSFRYKVISKSGKVDEIDIKYGISISNSLESEVDLTGDASINDEFENENITYSKGIPNNAERPRYLIDKDVDGKPNLATKWCCSAKGPNQRWVVLEFGDIVSITKFMLSHGATSTSNSFDKNMKGINTVEYEIYTSLDGINWTKVVHHKNNTDNITIDKLDEAVEAKYVKLNVINGGFDITARIYDMRIYGSR